MVALKVLPVEEMELLSKEEAAAAEKNKKIEMQFITMHNGVGKFVWWRTNKYALLALNLTSRNMVCIVLYLIWMYQNLFNFRYTY